MYLQYSSQLPSCTFFLIAICFLTLGMLARVEERYTANVGRFRRRRCRFLITGPMIAMLEPLFEHWSLQLANH